MIPRFDTISDIDDIRWGDYSGGSQDNLWCLQSVSFLEYHVRTRLSMKNYHKVEVTQYGTTVFRLDAYPKISLTGWMAGLCTGPGRMCSYYASE